MKDCGSDIDMGMSKNSCHTSTGCFKMQVICFQFEVGLSFSVQRGKSQEKTHSRSYFSRQFPTSLALICMPNSHRLQFDVVQPLMTRESIIAGRYFNSFQDNLVCTNYYESTICSFPFTPREPKFLLHRYLPSVMLFANQISRNTFSLI